MWRVVWLAAVVVLVGACGGSGSSARPSSPTSGGAASGRTVKGRDLPADLRNLWEKNVGPDEDVSVVDTSAGPVFVTAGRFAFGSCAATKVMPGRETYTVACNP